MRCVLHRILLQQEVMEKNSGLDGLQGFVVLRCLNSHPCVHELEIKVSVSSAEK